MERRKHEQQPMKNDARIAVLETTILNINATLLDIRQDIKRSSDKTDSRFDAMDKKFDGKFDGMQSRFDSLQNRMWSNFLWLMGAMIGLAGLIARAQHWI